MSQIDIEQYVQRKVKDGAFYGDIIPAMSRAARFIAASEKPLILLPGLLGSADVTTSITLDHVTMPATYFRQLYKVYSAALTDDIDIYDNRMVMESVLGKSQAGSLKGVFVEDGNLYYSGIPTVADTLTLYFYEQAGDFVNGEDDAVAWLPTEFHNKLIGNYAAAEILADMADDPEYGAERRALAGERGARCMNAFNAAMVDLYAKTHKSRPKQRIVKLGHTRFF